MNEREIILGTILIARGARGGGRGARRVGERVGWGDQGAGGGAGAGWGWLGGPGGRHEAYVVGVV